MGKRGREMLFCIALLVRNALYLKFDHVGNYLSLGIGRVGVKLVATANVGYNSSMISNTLFNFTLFAT